MRRGTLPPAGRKCARSTSCALHGGGILRMPQRAVNADLGPCRAAKRGSGDVSRGPERIWAARPRDRLPAEIASAAEPPCGFRSAAAPARADRRAPADGPTPTVDPAVRSSPLSRVVSPSARARFPGPRASAATRGVAPARARRRRMRASPASGSSARSSTAGRLARGLGHQVQAVVHAVGEVDVRVPGRSEHDRVARGSAAEARGWPDRRRRGRPRPRRCGPRRALAPDRRAPAGGRAARAPHARVWPRVGRARQRASPAAGALDGSRPAHFSARPPRPRPGGAAAP